MKCMAGRIVLLGCYLLVDLTQLDFCSVIHIETTMVSTERHRRGIVEIGDGIKYEGDVGDADGDDDNQTDIDDIGYDDDNQGDIDYTDGGPED